MYALVARRAKAQHQRSKGEIISDKPNGIEENILFAKRNTYHDSWGTRGRKLSTSTLKKQKEKSKEARSSKSTKRGKD
jgi:hypothetical protein